MNTQDTLARGVKTLGNNVQETLRASASAVGDKAAEARAKVEDGLQAAQDRLITVHENVKAKGREGFAATELYVRANPWNAVGIAAGIGLILGIGFTVGLISRRRGK
jgi:ElaB/YqjD/DUF883 family membrane-anchored ribosome-binding protein